MRRHLLLLLLAAAFLGCNHEKPVVEPKIDQSAFMAPLLVNARYWRFEELTIEQGGSKKTIDLGTDTTVVAQILRTSVIRHYGFFFDNGPVATAHQHPLRTDIVELGPYGNIPYSTNRPFRLFLTQTSEMGQWRWDDDKQTVEILFGPGFFDSIIESVSKNRFKPTKGYLDNKTPASYQNLEEATAGKAPDRIKIHVIENDPNAGEIKYTFTMRGAWLSKLMQADTRSRVYEAIY